MPEGSILGRIIIQNAGSRAQAQTGGAMGSSGGGDAEIRKMKMSQYKQEEYARKNERNNKQQPRMWQKVMKGMGISTNMAGMLKQSQLFTGVVGSIYQIIGAFIDVSLAPLIPHIMPLIRKFARGIPTWAKWMANFWDFVVRWVKKIWGWIKDPRSFFVDLLTGLEKMLVGAMNLLKYDITRLIEKIPGVSMLPGMAMAKKANEALVKSGIESTTKWGKNTRNVGLRPGDTVTKEQKEFDKARGKAFAAGTKVQDSDFGIGLSNEREQIYAGLKPNWTLMAQEKIAGQQLQIAQNKYYGNLTYSDKKKLETRSGGSHLTLSDQWKDFERYGGEKPMAGASWEAIPTGGWATGGNPGGGGGMGADIGNAIMDMMTGKATALQGLYNIGDSALAFDDTFKLNWSTEKGSGSKGLPWPFGGAVAGQETPDGLK